MVETVQRTAGRMSWFHDMAGETHAELREALEDSRGSPVAVGLYPPWLNHGPDVVTAYVPDEAWSDPEPTESLGVVTRRL